MGEGPQTSVKINSNGELTLVHDKAKGSCLLLELKYAEQE